jgi:hypothetical protein
VFRLLYLLIEDPAPWMAYVQFLTMAFLMGLTYFHATRRRMGFMIMFVVMVAIFFVDVLAYLAFVGYLAGRNRRPAVAK